MKTFEPQPRQLLMVLLVCDAVFAAIYFASLHIGSDKVHLLFDLDAEANIPAWFSSIQLFCVALLLTVFGPCRFRSLGLPVFVPLLGAGVFLFLSMDEIAQVHERVGRALRTVPFLPRVRENRGMWVFVYLAAALPFLIVALRYLPALWRGYRTMIIAGVIGCVFVAAGAVGVELVVDEYIRGYADMHYIYLLSVLAEEVFELLGGTMILFGALHLAFPVAEQVLYRQTAHNEVSATPIPLGSADHLVQH